MGFELRFTDKEVTAWGGMGLMKRLLDHLDFDSALQLAGLPRPGSNLGYRPEQLIIQFMLSIWCGANGFEHTEVTRHDPVLKRLFGFKRMANFKAIMRLFRKFSQADNEHIANSLYHWQFQQLGIDGLTLDLDSAVMTRYGTQEGTARGYSSSKPGRVSHHPLMAFIADTRMIANCWLRPVGRIRGQWLASGSMSTNASIPKARRSLCLQMILPLDSTALVLWSLYTTLPAQEVWRTYRGRADCENRIKEFKYDFAADSFCLKEFWATEASLTMVMLAYNFMSLFRQAALRHSIISGGKDVLRLAVAMRQHQCFEGVWDKSKSFDRPVTFSPVFTP